ncbi:hypothetical protein KUTeg_007065, partial [Tegillarca granosa]
HCSHGTCKSDSRYPDKFNGALFIPFAKTRTDLGKCLRWISLCRRPHSQLNKEKIIKHTYICSKTNTNFNFNTLNTTQSPIRNRFEFYTGMTYARFLMLLSFLFPSENGNHNPVVYDSKRKEIHQDKFPLSEQVFLYLCRLRNGLSIKDLAFRFNIKVQTVSTVMNSIAKYMYARLGSLSHWPTHN